MHRYTRTRCLWLEQFQIAGPEALSTSSLPIIWQSGRADAIAA